MVQKVWTRNKLLLDSLFIFILAAVVRFTSLNSYLIVDEEDRWAWALGFFEALRHGNLAGTLVGDGYPGIFPAWLETIWLFIVSLYRSVLQGAWLGEPGIYALTHDWGRLSNLVAQRFPIVFTNTVLVILIFLYTRTLFDRRVALLAGIFIALDPFYLSDSRVNRAEGLLTGLMAVSFLALLTATKYAPLSETPQTNKTRLHLIVSGFFGGLAWLTKSQSLVLLPMFGAITLLWSLKIDDNWQLAFKRWVLWLAGWGVIAGFTFILLWPAIWTVPGDTFGLMYSYATRKVGAEGVNLFFLGRTLLDEDPGLLFYPIIFLLRITPLVLIGLLLGLVRLGGYLRNFTPRQWRAYLGQKPTWALLAYILLYVGGMTLGSHKQDRFLMAVFPMLNILGAITFVQLAQRKGWSGWSIKGQMLAAGTALVIQLITVLPFHPYYFSYFNPLVGGGPVAMQLTRIGWGEGMDQVAIYLNNSTPNPEDLEIASRFYQYLLNFKGKIVKLDPTGEWTQADKIVFYIQQVQRMQDPSPGIIRYFQQHVPPEKVITIDWIDYAWVYPNPIQYGANPQLDYFPDAVSLLGYRWLPETAGAGVHLIWENLSTEADTLAVRLVTDDSVQTDWVSCETRTAFEPAFQTMGEVVESACHFDDVTLSPGLYTLQIGRQSDDGAWAVLDFAAGWSVIQVSNTGVMTRIDPATAFEALANAALPATATRLEHTYAYKIRLLGYQFERTTLNPGETTALTLYWQAVQPIRQPAHVTIQTFVNGQPVLNSNGPPLAGARETTTWRIGEVLSDTWTITIPPEMPVPALGVVGVGLFDPETVVPWQVRNRAGVDIPNAIGDLYLVPPTWPVYTGDQPLEFVLDDKVNLTGYQLTPGATTRQMDVTLFWQPFSSFAEDYIAFVHVLAEDGTLLAQSDVSPEHGDYPTSAWQMGDTVLSHHHLELPATVRPGTYTLVAGLYRPADWQRLTVVSKTGEPLPNAAAPLGEVVISVEE